MRIFIASLLLTATSFAATTVPAELETTTFSGSDITPSPACLAAAPTGEVFVGVDLNGSLGKGPGKGRIVRLVDKDGDGKADEHTVFAEIDNPRGLIAIGEKLYVLHTVIPKETGILSGMHLSVLTDADHDGIADGPAKRLVSEISTVKHNQDRGADHTTNGIRLGIDGWIYIAVGDFGFVNAQGTDGTKLTMHGGGVVRVRPDGTELEIYTHGTRNDYDVAIDPLMNIFSRGNTNDGGGWNIRFIHHIQSGEYGYPVLFKNFTDEILPALVDLGGGSGTGALFFQEPGWPEKFNNVPMMADWGRNKLYIHRLKSDGASFTQTEEEFIKEEQISDVDVDGSGRMYLAAWAGAGYKGSPQKGYISRVVPKGWTYTAFPDLKKAKLGELIQMLEGPSATARVYASQELLTRKDASKEVAALAADSKKSLEARVAAIFTYKQIAGSEATETLVKLSADKAVKEWALRALTDRKTQLAKVTSAPLIAALKDSNPRVQATASVALGRLGKVEAAPALLALSNPPAGLTPPEEGKEGPHATPNSAVILPHIAVQSLRALNATSASLEAVGGPNSLGALWTLRTLHDPAAVDGLIKKFATVKDPAAGDAILSTLIRLYQKGEAYDGSYWWGTRPDTRGPVYKPIKWEASDKIAAFIAAEHAKSTPARKAWIELQCRRTRSEIPGLNIVIAQAIAPAKKKNEPKVDLTKIKKEGGELAKMSIEDIVLELDKVKGDPALGRDLFTRQGCVACHTLTADEPVKGPYMGQIGSILDRHRIAESILKPNASISQGFATCQIQTKDKTLHVGFVSGESPDQIQMRDITGRVWSLKTADILSRKELEQSMMPEGLVNALSLQEFAALVTFLEQQKK